MKCAAFILLLALPACAGLPAPLAAPPFRALPDAGITLRQLAEARIGTKDLAGMRGGIRLGGIDFGIGVTLRTSEAAQQLVSQLTLTDAGQWMAGSAVSSGAPALVTGVGTGNFRAVLGDPATTQVVHSLSGNAIGTAIANRADNVAIIQATELNFTVNNYAQLSRGLFSVPMMSRLGHDIAGFRIR